MAKAFQTDRDRTEYVDTDVFLGELRSELYRRECDTLDEKGNPVRSPDRSRCHPRDSRDEWRTHDAERIAKIIRCPKGLLSGLPCENFKEYDDPHTAWAVNTAVRLAIALFRWADEEMTEELYHYYVYVPMPCSVRVRRIAGERPSRVSTGMDDVLTGSPSSAMDDLLTHWLVDKPDLSKKVEGQYIALRKAAEEEDRRYEQLRGLLYWNEKDFNPTRVKKCAGALGDTLNYVASRVLHLLQKAKQERKGTAGKRKMSKEEANVLARQLLCETPTWDWTTRKLAKQIPCSLGWIPRLPVWRLYKERRDQVRKQGTIKTVSLTSEREAVLGTGDRDETLNRLIAEQEQDQREDGRQAKLYVSHEKKPKRRES
jgi:hypothetical protein